MPRPDAVGASDAEVAGGAFSTTTLTIPVADTTRLAAMQVDGLETVETEVGTELRSPTGALLAVATSRRLRDGSVGCELAHPPDNDGGPVDQIRRAVAPYEV